MEGWITLGIILIFAAYFFGRVGYAIENDKQEKSEYDKINESIDNAINKEDKQTRNLLVSTLENIGCQYETNSKDNIISNNHKDIYKMKTSSK